MISLKENICINSGSFCMNWRRPCLSSRNCLRALGGESIRSVILNGGYSSQPTSVYGKALLRRCRRLSFARQNKSPGDKELNVGVGFLRRHFPLKDGWLCTMIGQSVKSRSPIDRIEAIGALEWICSIFILLSSNRQPSLKRAFAFFDKRRHICGKR